MLIQLELSGNGLNSILLDDCEQPQRRSTRLLDATLPVRNQVLTDIQVAGKKRLRQVLTLALRTNLIGRQSLNGREARFVKLAHGALVDCANLGERFHCLVDSAECFTAVVLRYLTVSSKTGLYRSTPPTVRRCSHRFMHEAYWLSIKPLRSDVSARLQVLRETLRSSGRIAPRLRAYEHAAVRLLRLESSSLLRP